MCLEHGEWTIAPLPYNIKAKSEGVAVCYPDDFIASDKFVAAPFVDQLTCGLVFIQQSMDAGTARKYLLLMFRAHAAF